MENQLELLKPEGFNKLYESYLSQTGSDKAAYQAAEDVFFERFKHTKYSNFKSFQNSRQQWLRIKKKNRQLQQLA